MYVCIPDPTTGNRLYADLVIHECVRYNRWGVDAKITRIEVKHVENEENLITAIATELRSTIIGPDQSLNIVLEETFGLSSVTPDFVDAVVETMEAMD